MWWRRAAANAALILLILWLAPHHPTWLWERPEGRLFLGLFLLWGAVEWIGLVVLSRLSSDWGTSPPLARWLDRLLSLVIVAMFTIALRKWEGDGVEPFYRYLCVALGGAGMGLRWWAMTTLGPRFNQQVAPTGPWVKTGPYWWFRHPAYVGLIMVLCALMGLLASRIGLLMVAVGVAPLLAMRGYLERRSRL